MQGLATKFQLLKSVWDYDNGTEKVDNNNWEKKKKKRITIIWRARIRCDWISITPKITIIARIRSFR